MTGVGVAVSGHCRGSLRGDDSEKCAFHQRCVVQQKLRTSSHLTQLECLNSVSPARSFTLPLPSSRLYLAFLVYVCKLPQIQTGIQQQTVFRCVTSFPSPADLFPFFIIFFICPIISGGSRSWSGLTALPTGALEPDGQIGHNGREMSRDSWVIWRDDMIRCNVSDRFLKS